MWYDEKYKLPRGEKAQTVYQTKDHETRFVLAVDALGVSYTMYEVADGQLKKLGKGANPAELEKKFCVL